MRGVPSKTPRASRSWSLSNTVIRCCFFQIYNRKWFEKYLMTKLSWTSLQIDLIQGNLRGMGLLKFSGNNKTESKYHVLLHNANCMAQDSDLDQIEVLNNSVCNNSPWAPDAESSPHQKLFYIIVCSVRENNTRFKVWGELGSLIPGETWTFTKDPHISTDSVK